MNGASKQRAEKTYTVASEAEAEQREIETAGLSAFCSIFSMELDQDLSSQSIEAPYCQEDVIIVDMSSTFAWLGEAASEVIPWQGLVARMY